MKNFLLGVTALGLLAPLSSWAQQTVPYKSGQNADGNGYAEIELFSSDGTYSSSKPMEFIYYAERAGTPSLVGASAVHLHTGAGTSYWANMAKKADGNGMDWRDAEVGKMENVGPNIWALSFTPTEFYGTDVVTHIGCVFNDGPGGSLEGKDNGGDYYIQLTEGGSTPEPAPISYKSGANADGNGYAEIELFSRGGKFSATDTVEFVYYAERAATPSLVGASAVHLHSGAGTAYWANMAKKADGNGMDWRDAEVGKMENVGPNIWSLMMIPSTFYGTDVVTHIGCVFNDGPGGSLEGKENGGDYYLLVDGATSVRDGEGIAYDIDPAFPNPVTNDAVTIRYAVRDAANAIRVSVFDQMGREVRTLVNEVKGRGAYTVQWDGTDASGNRVQNGAYFYRISTGNFVTTKKLILNR